jgi:hypothetical protein
MPLRSPLRERGALANDDRLDALAIAVSYWVEHMARDTEKAADDHKTELLEASLRDFANTVFGINTGGSSMNDGGTWF